MIHLKRFLWYYRTVTGKDFPESGEEVIVSHDSILLAGLDYWKFIYTIRKLLSDGYLVRNSRRRYVITPKLVRELKYLTVLEDVTLRDKIYDTVINFYLFLFRYPSFRSVLMMEMKSPSEKEFAELLKKFYEVMDSVNERLGVIIKKLEELRKEIKGEVSDMQEEVGRVITDTKQ